MCLGRINKIFHVGEDKRASEEWDLGDKTTVDN